MCWYAFNEGFKDSIIDVDILWIDNVEFYIHNLLTVNYLIYVECFDSL